MPPRKDHTTDDVPPTISDQLSQLITATTSASSNTTAQLTALIETTTTLAQNIAKLSDQLSAETFRTGSPKSSDGINSSSSGNRNHPKTPKITLPLFDGTNPLGWIFQAENYFSYYRIPQEERVELTVFHFIGDALSWYQNLSNNGLLGSWTAFKREVELRFGPSSFENHQATLFKLRQTSTVTEYQTEFERVSNRVTGLSQEALRNCYISGLRSDIQNELALHRPTTLYEACSLSRLIEDKLGPITKSKTVYNPKPFTSNWQPPSYLPATSSTSSTNSTPNPNPPLLPLPPKMSSSLPITRLSL